MFRQGALVAFLCAWPAAAQQSSGVPGGADRGPLIPSARTRSPAMDPNANALRSTFRLDVKMIEVPVNVNDDFGRPVRGLPQSAFRVFEDEVEQNVTSFSN